MILMALNQYSLDYRQNSINISEHEVNGRGYCNSFVFDMFLYKFSFIGIKEKGNSVRGTFCCHGDADDLS